MSVTWALAGLPQSQASQLPQWHRALDFYETLKNSLSTIIEIHHPASDISRDYELAPYGLTDVGIVAAAKDNYLVLTDDLRVAGFAHQHCVDVVNFNHIREASWEV